MVVVSSDHGGVSPSAGTNWLNVGMVHCYVTNRIQILGGATFSVYEKFRLRSYQWESNTGEDPAIANEARSIPINLSNSFPRKRNINMIANATNVALPD